MLRAATGAASSIKTMRYGSICSGVEAATLAWEPLGWDCGWVSEIEPFPCAVLHHHWPDTPNLGDMTDETFLERSAARGPIQCLVAGTPCQSFSVAGLRGGLGDDRGNLALRFCQVALDLQPPWLVWENVPGVLSSNGGRDFGAILRALVECGYGFAYRVLDAQYFGVPQRRRRVILVGYFGDWRPPAAVLFEREVVQRDITPRRETREDAAADAGSGITHSLTSRIGVAEEDGTGRGSPLAVTVAAQRGSHQSGSGQRYDLDHETYVPEIAMIVNAREDPITASGKSLPLGARDTGHAVCYPINSMAALRDQGADQNRQTFGIGANGDPLPTLSNQHHHAIAFQAVGDRGNPSINTYDVMPPLMHDTGSDRGAAICQSLTVRRLTPVECERLQGMPDHHTRIPWRSNPAEDCPDGPRYRAIGNSMAVPVMRWIGERIELVDRILSKETA